MTADRVLRGFCCFELKAIAAVNIFACMLPYGGMHATNVVARSDLEHISHLTAKTGRDTGSFSGLCRHTQCGG